MAGATPKSKAYIMEADLAKLSLQDDSFADWFWKGSNGNNLIEYINSYQIKQHGKKSDFIRREKDSPSIYGIVVNQYSPPEGTPAPPEPFKKLIGSKHLKLVKIGMTQICSDPKEGTSRMNTLRAKWEKEGFTTAVIFNLPINFIDSRKLSVIEKYVREKCGLSIKKECIANVGLSVPTEWVITTQDFIDHVKNSIETKKAETVATTAVFRGINFDEQRKKKLKEYAKGIPITVDDNGVVKW